MDKCNSKRNNESDSHTRRLLVFSEESMAEKDEYIIKTKFGQSFDFVYIDENELSIENFVKNGKYCD